MRSLEFSFKHGEKDSGKNITNALLHHAYPKRHSLLFAYDYKYDI
jgi:myotubularin-related protein 10/11/12